MAAFEESRVPLSMAAPEFYTWTFPGAPVRIHLHLTVVESLAREVQRAFESVPSHSVEIGGILYGTADFAASPVVEVKDFEPFLCEYRPDHRFILSDADRRRLEKVLGARRTEGPDALSVVGCYRSHIGDGLSLRAEDTAIAQASFYDPANVFLLVKPSSEGPPSAGFFFWDKGHIHADFSYLEFPFDARQLTGSRVKPTLGQHVEPITQPEMPPEAPAFDLPASIPANFDSSPSEPRQRSPNILWRSVFAVLMLALGALGYQAYLAWAPSRSASPVPVVSDAPALSLQVERRGADLRISWNRNSRTVTQATGAVLSIRDGESQQQELHLDLEQLRNGSVLYTPANSTVRFRLETTTPDGGKTSESVLAITAARPGTEAALPAAAPPTTGPSPQSDAAAANSPAPGADRTFGDPLRVVMVDGPKPHGSTAVPESTPSPTAREDAADPSALYLPANATHQVQPVLSAAVRRLIAKPVEVSVKVTISAAGRVEQAEPLPTRELVSSSLVNAARDAAKRWRFAPAIRGTQTVPSELVLKFQFLPAR